MKKNKVQTEKFQNWNYERFQLHSNILNLDCHFGVIRQSDLTDIDMTLYLFHGGGADDTQAAQAGLLNAIPELLKSNGRTQIVFPYIGNSFLCDHPTDSSKSYSQYFLNEILTESEHNTQTKPETRLLGGWSMGGQAALSLFMRHPSLFAGVGAHFPTLINFDYHDDKQTGQYGQRLSLNKSNLEILTRDLQHVFRDYKDFSAHDPLSLAKQLSPTDLAKKKIYFDVGLEDEFGLYEGCMELHQILQNKSIAHYFENIPGGKHDGMFLYQQLPKMLKYLLL